MSDLALDGVRVLDLSRGIAGPLAAMLLADHGAEVIRPESPGADPERERPGFVMWNRNKTGVLVDPGTEAGRERLSSLMRGADVCVGGGTGPFAEMADPATSTEANPALVYLSVPPFLGETPWAGGSESVGLLAALTGIALRQSSFEGGPIDPVFPYVLYLQAAWAAAAGVAALIERESSGHGQVVTVGGVQAAMVSATQSLVLDPEANDIVAAFGPGGPHPMYTRYQCADGEWLFMATLTSKFQQNALEALGLADVMADERIGGRIEAMLLPANRAWVRQRFVEVFASKSREQWLKEFRAADVPAGPVLRRDEWMDSPVLSSIGMRVDLEDPTHGATTMPGNPVNLVATPWELRRPAPAPGEDEPIAWSPRPAPAAAPPAREGGPLSGFRVLDLGTILAGPYAGTLLAELGADVIKVEIPAGDSWRDRGMPYIRGQRGVAIDLQSTSGKETFHTLVRSADVVLDNYRAGVLQRLAIDYPHLAKVKADVVSVSITGYGPEGPFSSDPAFDPLLQARSGMMSSQGGDSEPVLMTVPVNDVTSASLAALATVLALFHRIRSGSGQEVWLSLASTSAFAQSEELVRTTSRTLPYAGGRDFRGPGPIDCFYATSDGWVRLHTTDVDSLAKAGLLEGGAADDSDLGERLAAAFAAMTRDEAVERLSAAGIPAAPARRMSELITDTEYQEWEVFNRLDRPGASAVFVPGRYARFSRSQHHETLRPPGVGEHTAEVLAEVGIGQEELDSLAESGAVRLGSPMVFRQMAAYR